MKSITRYLFINASIWAIIIAFASGIVLTEFFRHSAEQSFDEQLDIVLKIMVGELAGQVEPETDLVPPSIVGEPRYELPLSGWYWTITDENSGEILTSSASLVGGGIKEERTRVSETVDGSAQRYYGTGPDNKKLRILERLISFGPDKSYRIHITGSAEDLNAQVSDFQRKAWITMGVFGAILLAVSLILVRTALRPLNILRHRVREVAEGHAETIEGKYPIEVSGLVNEANILISTNKDTLERARTQVGNLAHALKTPLSVIINETRNLDQQKAALLVQQADIMRDQIQLYLERARMAARRNAIGTVTKVEPIMSKLTEVMQKIHRDKTVEFNCNALEGVSFRGEQHDLEEMAGNLIDNACKWAKDHVSVTLFYSDVSSFSDDDATNQTNHYASLIISIEDDGLGMTQEQVQQALKRGQRLDESVPGTGLGLSIVLELTSLYQGNLVLGRSELGGTKASLILPAIEQH